MRKWYDLLGSYHVRLKCVSLVKKKKHFHESLLQHPDVGISIWHKHESMYQCFCAAGCGIMFQGIFFGTFFIQLCIN